MTAKSLPLVFPDAPTLVDVWRCLVSRFNHAELTFGHGYISAFDEAWALISHVLALPYPELAERELFLSARLTADELSTIRTLAQRRLDERLPMAYLTGEAWLGGFAFPAEAGVIVPRSLLAAPLLQRMAPWLPEDFVGERVLEVCCGSASLLVLAAMAFPEARLDGVDLNPQAIRLAQKTIASYGMEGRINLYQGDLYAPLPDAERGTYDLIIANPPYVDDATMSNLPAEYRAEPALALAGGGDGLDLVRRIVAEAAPLLAPQGYLLLEMGDHAAALMQAFPTLAPILLNNDSDQACIALFTAADLRRLTSTPTAKRTARKRP